MAAGSEQRVHTAESGVGARISREGSEDVAFSRATIVALFCDGVDCSPG